MGCDACGQTTECENRARILETEFAIRHQQSNGEAFQDVDKYIYRNVDKYVCQFRVRQLGGVW